MKANVFASIVTVLKSAPKMAMGMLVMSISLIFCACTKEDVNYHPTSAKNLMTSVDSTMVLGATDVTIEGTATTAEGTAISGQGNLSYVGLPKVYVEQLGLPTAVSTTDGTNFVSSDGNNFRRTFNWTGNVNVSSTGVWSETVILKQLNDSTELAEARFNENWDVWTNQLPSTFEGAKQGKEIVRVLYKRVVKPVAPEPEPVVEYRMRSEFDEAVDGDAYFTVFAEKVVNGKVAKTWKTYVAGISFGTWRPNVSAQVVNSTNFTVQDSTDSLKTDEPRHNLGTEKAFSVVNTSKVEYHFIAGFEAPRDAEGNTTRTVAGHINVWSRSVVFHNPETGEDMNYDFVGTAETTTHEVDGNNVYRRVVTIKCNGETVDTQEGTVQLTIQ
jgi:hypothetical protein